MASAWCNAVIKNPRWREEHGMERGRIDGRILTGRARGDRARPNGSLPATGVRPRRPWQEGWAWGGVPPSWERKSSRSQAGI